MEPILTPEGILFEKDVELSSLKEKASAAVDELDHAIDDIVKTWETDPCAALDELERLKLKAERREEEVLAATEALKKRLTARLSKARR
jgi:hypothetical protein